MITPELKQILDKQSSSQLIETLAYLTKCIQEQQRMDNFRKVLLK